MQQYADIYLLLNYSTCFGRPLRTSSGVHETVVAASGTEHTIWEACSPDGVNKSWNYMEVGVKFWVLWQDDDDDEEEEEDGDDFFV